MNEKELLENTQNTEDEELTMVCEQGMYGELEIADPTKVKVEK